MTNRGMCVVYAALAVVGAVATWYFNFRFMQSTGGFDLIEFIKGGFADPAAGSLSADVLVAAAAFLIWVLREASRLNMRYGWIYVLLTLTVAFAFAFPLFLLMRQIQLGRLDEKSPVPG